MTTITRRNTTRVVSFALCCLALTIVVAVLALLGASDTELLAACLAMTLIIPLLARGILHGQFDFFYPPTLFSFLVLIGYLLPLGDFLRGTDVFTAVWHYQYRTFERSINLALIMTTLGAGSFFVGFAAAARIRYRPLPSVSMFVPQRMRIVGLVYTLVGLALFAVGVVLVGGVAGLLAGMTDRIRAFAGLNYFFMATFLPIDFALMWWAHLLATRRLFTPWFWIYAAFALALSSLTGSRANSFVVVLAAVILYHLRYKTIPFRRVLVLLAVGAVALFAWQVLFKEYVVTGKLLTISANPTFSEVWSRFSLSLGKDFYQIQALTLVVDAVPGGIPYQHGSTYVPLLLAPIPSSIWAGKLAFLSSPGVLTLALWPESWLNAGTTVPPSLMGEMYMNFGALGVGMGMAVFGALYGYAYASVKRNPENLVVAIAYAGFVALMFHYIRGEFSAPTILLVFLALPVLVAAPLVGKRRRANEHASAAK